jgi:drug/metabolite transporter (DMT)-like permease
MLIQAGVPSELAALALQCVGWGEVLLGLLTLALWRKPWMFAATIALMLCATVGTICNSPQYLSAAFNPISLNLLMASMALVGWLTCHDLPSARRCIRVKPAHIS